MEKITPSQIKSGMKFGHWKVLKFSHKNKHGIFYFLCKCEVCGTIRPVRGTSLINGTSTACSKKCSDNLYGRTFGEWTVLRDDPNNKRNYICQCSCGRIKSLFGPSVKYGKTLSCGCKRIEKTKANNKKNAQEHVGEKHGWLTIKDYELRGKNYWYVCDCDCGSEVTVMGKNLFNGNTSSCGCMNSKANELMDKILRDKGIPFKREYKFEDCRDIAPLPFDFAIFNKSEELLGLIELNGSLHYSSSGTGWDTPERLLYQQKHDYLKRKFCEDSKIPFLVIPYQYFNDLEKFLMTSDFWQIITKNFND